MVNEQKIMYRANALWTLGIRASANLNRPSRGKGGTMEQEHTPLWSVERIFRAIAAVNGGSDDPYVTLEATGKVLRKLHDEYEAARREQAQRVAEAEEGAAEWKRIARINREHIEKLQQVYHEIEQTLGAALGYPRYVDDPENFPDATEADGVCVGEHVPETLAQEAAQRIEQLERELSDVTVWGQACDDLRLEAEAEVARLTQRNDELMGIGTPYLDSFTEAQLERYAQLSPPEMFRLLLDREAEAARREQAQRVAALEALRREQYERANGLSESNNALLDENIAYRQRVEQLEAEVARLTQQRGQAESVLKEILATLGERLDIWTEQHVANVLGNGDHPVTYDGAFNLAMRIIAHHQHYHQLNVATLDELQAEVARLKAQAWEPLPDGEYTLQGWHKPYTLRVLQNGEELEAWFPDDVYRDGTPKNIEEIGVGPYRICRRKQEER